MTNILFFVRYCLFKIRYIKQYFGPFCKIGKNSTVIIELGGRLEVGTNVVIKPNVTIYVKKNGLLKIGNRVSIGHSSEISVNAFASIGDDVITGAYCYISDSNHHFSTPDIPIKKQGMQVGKVIVENNVWLGRGAFILKDSHISENTVVGANSVVSSKLNANSVYAGVPVKRIKGLYE